MRAIFTLFLLTAVATATALEPPESYVEHQLRGANTEVNEDRELLTMGESSTSLSFSLASGMGSDKLCFDAFAICMEEGGLFTAAYTDTDASGNAFAIAFSAEYLWLVATCKAYAAAYAKSCAFAEVEGKVDAYTQAVDGKKHVSLNVILSTATMAFAKASSDAVAKAYAEAGAYSFTGVAAFCDQVKNMSPLCTGGTAETDLEQFAIAKAGAFGEVVIPSYYQPLVRLCSVRAQGKILNYVSGVIAAYAKSWAFADAGAAAGAFADAFTVVDNISFAGICVAQHKEICGKSDYADRGICNDDAEDACASALAAGGGFAEALSIAYAKAFIEACAKAEIFIFLSANVDCTSTPIFTWKCTKAGVRQSCS